MRGMRPRRARDGVGGPSRSEGAQHSEVPRSAAWSGLDSVRSTLEKSAGAFPPQALKSGCLRARRLLCLDVIQAIYDRWFTTGGCV
jgi:hypothetical protein